MRVIGYVLLLWGFLCLFLSAVSTHKDNIMKYGRHVQQLPNQEVFTRSEVENIIGKVSFDNRADFLPPLLMLGGGLLLGITKRKQKAVAIVATEGVK